MHTTKPAILAFSLRCAFAGLALTSVCAAHAQSSVTLYGILDAGGTYVSNSGGSRLAEFSDGVS